ncbi:hypothetical protein K1719_008676 [Acacia pycnantha]|nr:hypothetical protein K1719_008676 [Acacia pycnantha]
MREVRSAKSAQVASPRVKMRVLWEASKMGGMGTGKKESVKLRKERGGRVAHARIKVVELGTNKGFTGINNEDLSSSCIMEFRIWSVVHLYKVDVVVILEPRIGGKPVVKVIKSWGFKFSRRVEAMGFYGEATRVGVRNFRFEVAWQMHNGFREFLTENWKAGNGFKEQLSTLQQSLQIWNREVFGKIEYRKRRILNRLNGIQQGLARHYNPYLIRAGEGP